MVPHCRLSKTRSDRKFLTASGGIQPETNCSVSGKGPDLASLFESIAATIVLGVHRIGRFVIVDGSSWSWCLMRGLGALRGVTKVR